MSYESIVLQIQAEIKKHPRLTKEEIAYREAQVKHNAEAAKVMIKCRTLSPEEADRVVKAFNESIPKHGHRRYDLPSKPQIDAALKEQLVSTATKEQLIKIEAAIIKHFCTAR